MTGIEDRKGKTNVTAFHDGIRLGDEALLMFMLFAEGAVVFIRDDEALSVLASSISICGQTKDSHGFGFPPTYP